MRIIAGEFKGRVLKAPRGRRIRPTADRVREAWFSILDAELLKADVLDLFAGSGALGLEALSRGASTATFVDRARSALQALQANIDTLGVRERVTVRKIRWETFLQHLETPFDITFADPPYWQPYAAAVVATFRRNPFSRILGVEHRAGDDIRGDRTAVYGDVAITFCYAP